VQESTESRGDGRVLFVSAIKNLGGEFMKRFVVILLVLAALAVAACGGSSTPEKKSAGGGASVSQNTDVTSAVNVDFTTMDPQDTNDTLSGGIQRMMMDGLFGFDDNMKIYPMLASGYKANADATEFTITLRQGIKFSDGAAWNADAALANISKWKGEGGIKLRRTSFLSNVIKSASKVDDYNIKIILNKPFGAFISNLAHPACVMMSPKVLAKGNEACAHNPAGTGQYKFVEWVAGDHLKLALNKEWWGYDAKLCGGKALAEKDAGFKTITFKPVAESATRVAMVQSGDAKIIWPVPTENMKSLEKDSKVKVYKDEGIVVRYVFMNNQKKPFNNLKVRQAIDYAINKEAYIKVVKNGLGSVATSVIGPKVQFYKGNTPVKYDPAKAKELLKEAGYPNGFTAEMMFSSTTANQKQAEFFKQQLGEVGINVVLKGMESAVVNQKVDSVDVPGEKAEVQMYLIGWSPSTGDADWGLRPLLAKESVPPHSYNISYFLNDELDKYIKQGLESADPKVRKEAYAKAQDLVWKEVPLICLSNDFNTWATDAHITGVKIYPDGAINMKNAKMSS
jgi:glutathione transport system substrate-binding protein